MTLRITFLASAALAVLATCANAAPVSANATASATIVAPNTVNATRNLTFGTIAKPTSGNSTVTVASAASGTATPTLTGAGNAYIPVSGQAAAATFRLVGTAGQTYSIGSTALTFVGQTGQLNNVGPETPVASVGSLGTLPGTGMEDLYIGGHFEVTPTTNTQVYNGTLALTVNFN